MMGGFWQNRKGTDDMNRRLWEIVEALSEEEYKTSAYLGEKLGISEKTVRNRINELNEEISSHGMRAVSRPRYGYCLEIDDRTAWEAFKAAKNMPDERIPEDSEERTDYLLAIFLNRDMYQKVEDLSEFLYVSPKTLSNEIKKVEYILSKFSLELERRPHYGMKIVGTEFNKRRCMLQHFYIRVRPFGKIQGEQEKISLKIAECLKTLALEYKIRFSETAFRDTVLYIYVSIVRMGRGLYIEDESKTNNADSIENSLAVKLYHELKSELKGEVTEPEIRYTGIYIAGKRYHGNDVGPVNNFVMSDKIDNLVKKILETIYETYHVELRDNLNLRMMLYQHMIPLEIRLKYGIQIEDWPSQEIRDKYVFAYTMAQQAAAVIARKYEKEVSENETACLAVYFELALEEEKSRQKKKKNILIVCVSGKASSRMLLYRFKREFEEYIESIQVCGMYDFDTYNLSNIDFIFSTVPIYKKVSVPIMEIHDFLEAGEVIAVRSALEVGEFDFLDRYYNKKYFFADLEAENREQAIHEICRRINKVIELPKEFEESVLQRESMGPTDFGNGTAIPHPCKIMTKETIVAVAVLKKEILWSTQKVRVIIMTALSEDSEDTRRFYEVTSSFLMNHEAVQALIDTPIFENFLGLLKRVNKK